MAEQTIQVVENVKPKPEFIEKHFHWGLCYGMLDPERMAAVIVKMTPDAREYARERLSRVRDGCIFKDEYTYQCEAKMREWGVGE